MFIKQWKSRLSLIQIATDKFSLNFNNPLQEPYVFWEITFFTSASFLADSLKLNYRGTREVRSYVAWFQKALHCYFNPYCITQAWGLCSLFLKNAIFSWKTCTEYRKQDPKDFNTITQGQARSTGRLQGVYPPPPRWSAAF